LIQETEQIEKELVSESSTFSDYINGMKISLNDIKNKIKKNEVIIDLVAFNYINKTATDSLVYAAFIVKKDSKFPKFMPLFEEKQLDFLLSRIKIQQDSTRINKQYLDKGISNLFLKPLEKELEGVTTIYLSPSGLGNQIDFAALPIKDTQTFGEKYKLHILNSPAELMDYKVATLEKKSKIELLLYGGIDYTKSNGNPSLNVDDNAISSNEDFINSSKRTGIEALPGTLKEVDGINANANKSGFSSKVFKESEATEESIKALDGKTTPCVLHLATHGFFFPEPIIEMTKDILSSDGKSKIYKTSEDPMMRSGLLLAGAKNYWGKSNQNNTIEKFERSKRNS
jgi:CHAT domain-containing protein